MSTETLQITGTSKINQDVSTTGSPTFASVTTGGGTTTYVPIVAQQSLSGPGAINITSYYTAVTTTGADAFTLADSTQTGQQKKITLVVDGGDATITPSHLSGGTTITMDDAGDYVLLVWNGTAWVCIENSGCTIA